MADPVIRLDAEFTSVQPGGQARVKATITNTGTVVDGYRLELLGPVAAWSRVDPPEVSIYPQQEASATVILQPPAGTSVPGGRRGFGVIARSTLDPQASATAEAVVEVAEVASVQAVVAPVTSTGPWHARHRVQLSNAGNTAAQLAIDASDPDETLGFRITPARVTLPPGGHADVDIRVVPKQAFLWRSAVRRPFRVTGARADGSPQFSVDAAFNQKPSGWMAVVLGVVVLLAVLTLLAPSLVNWWSGANAPAGETPSLAARGAPPKPVIEVRADGSAAAIVEWEGLESAEQYFLRRVEPDGTVSQDPKLEIDGTGTSTKVMGLTPVNPKRIVCFQLQVVRGGMTSPWSDPGCVALAPPPATPTPTPTPTPVDPDKPTLTAVYGAETLDGLTDNWPWDKEASAQFLATPTVPTSVIGKVYLRWDETALYVLAKVNDTTPAQPGSNPDTIWRGDAVTVELGLARPMSAAESIRASDRYYMFGYRTPPNAPPFIAEGVVGVLGPNGNYTSFDRRLGIGQARAVVARDPGGGYLLEARIPWPFPQVPPRAGLELAANVNISDRKTSSQTAMVSTNSQRAGNQGHPAYWQRLTLG